MREAGWTVTPWWLLGLKRWYRSFLSLHMHICVFNRTKLCIFSVLSFFISLCIRTVPTIPYRAVQVRGGPSVPPVNFVYAPPSSRSRTTGTSTTTTRKRHGQAQQQQWTGLLRRAARSTNRRVYIMVSPARVPGPASPLPHL